MKAKYRMGGRKLNKVPIVAIMYDFDKTLCTKDMQEYAFIPALGMTAEEFWKEAQELTDREEMDSILAYMLKMVEKAKEKKIHIQRSTLQKMGEDVEFFEGVESWFDRINGYAREIGIRVEHYIVSSGLKEIIEGTPIAKQFKKIYACEFLYDYTGMIQWPKFAVNYTTKTQFLFRINKGVLTVDTRSERELNAYKEDRERRIPFSNMIYVGDGLTDVPCMKLVKVNGGQSIAVYNRDQGRQQAGDLMKANRVNFVVPADYSEGSQIEVAVKVIMNKVKAVEELAETTKSIAE